MDQVNFNFLTFSPLPSTTTSSPSLWWLDQLKVVSRDKMAAAYSTPRRLRWHTGESSSGPGTAAAALLPPLLRTLERPQASSSGTEQLTTGEQHTRSSKGSHGKLKVTWMTLGCQGIISSKGKQQQGNGNKAITLLALMGGFLNLHISNPHNKSVCLAKT